jgi:hypothetical protein
MMSVMAFYQKQVNGLPVTDRLQLARLIMDDLADSAPTWVVDSSEAWSDEDVYDLGRATLVYAARLSPDDEDDAEPG